MKKKLIAIMIATSLFYEMVNVTNAATTYDATTGYSNSGQNDTGTTRKAILRKKGLIRYLLDGGYDNFSNGVKDFFQEAYGSGAQGNNTTEYNQGNNVTNNDFGLDIGNSIKEDGNNDQNSQVTPQVTPPEENNQNSQVTPQTPAPAQPQQTTPQTPAAPSNNGGTTTQNAAPKQSQQTTPSTQNTSDKFMAQVEQAIFTKVNQERTKAGAANLSYNSTMEKYGRVKSQDMGDRGYFSHTDPEGNLMTVKMQKDGVTYSAWGENIAYIGGITDSNALANQFMTNWMNSPGHKANILSKNFAGIGVGVYRIGNKVYATQEFIR